MSRLPVISGEQCARALERAGFQFVRQRGSHMAYVRESPHAKVIVPNPRELAPGTLRSIIQQAGMGLEEFRGLL
jgi:predicted RNA binding protein YcfA (HicA-like mRNA interferase family)